MHLPTDNLPASKVSTIYSYTRIHSADLAAPNMKHRILPHSHALCCAKHTPCHTKLHRNYVPRISNNLRAFSERLFSTSQRTAAKFNRAEIVAKDANEVVVAPPLLEIAQEVQLYDAPNSAPALTLQLPLRSESDNTQHQGASHPSVSTELVIIGLNSDTTIVHTPAPAPDLTSPTLPYTAPILYPSEVEQPAFTDPLAEARPNSERSNVDQDLVVGGLQPALPVQPTMQVQLLAACSSSTSRVSATWPHNPHNSTSPIAPYPDNTLPVAQSATISFQTVVADVTTLPGKPTAKRKDSPAETATSPLRTVATAQSAVATAAAVSTPLAAPTSVQAPSKIEPPVVSKVESPASGFSGLFQRFSEQLRTLPWGKLWALGLLSATYIHHGATATTLPAMLPMISADLHLSDLQGALLTTGYSYLYALTLVPIGMLADRMSRPQLLGAGALLWSLLTATASYTRSFSELFFARIGFAAAQSVQNPICFSLLPELFPKNKSTALAVYNCAAYLGRSLSFSAVLAAKQLQDQQAATAVATATAAAAAAVKNAVAAALTGGVCSASAAGSSAVSSIADQLVSGGSPWRQVLRWVALPGVVLALAAAFTLSEPRAAVSAPTQSATIARTAGAAASSKAAAQTVATPAASSSGVSVSPIATASTTSSQAANASPVAAAATNAKISTKAPATKTSNSSKKPKESFSFRQLLASPGFMSVTVAAALNDVGSYSLIAWQSTFYERVFHLAPSYYAPILSLLLSVGGVLGGVGGGFLADKLSQEGKRVWVTAGACLMAVPFLALSCATSCATTSFAAVAVGFALSECWRAPAAVMARSIAPPSMGSTASATYLCIRNLIGGIGPLAIALMAQKVGLQTAMMLIPAAYCASGLLFWWAERLYEEEVGCLLSTAEAEAS